MDDIEEWSGCSYIQLKEMSQDMEQWRRKAIEWSSAVANRHRRWSTSEWVSDVYESDLFIFILLNGIGETWDGKPLSLFCMHCISADLAELQLQTYNETLVM